MDEVPCWRPGDRSNAIVEQARGNIDKIRKRDVELRVVDRRGQPVANSLIRIVQTAHAFPFGDQLQPLDGMFRCDEHDTDRGRYWKLRFTEALNAANALCYWTERPRNDCPKTEDRQGFPRLEGFHYCVDWAASQGLIVKGHPLFWSIPKAVPEWVKRYDCDTQMKLLEVRIRGLVSSVRGRVQIWDVINEPLWEPALRNLPNRRWPHLEAIDQIADYVVAVLRWARDEDPDACYILNDYGLQADALGGPPVAADGTKVTAALQRERLLALVDCLFERGAPPNAIGLQSHTGGWIEPAAQMAVYDQLATAGLPLHITEFSASTSRLEDQGGLSQQEIERIQADYAADYLTCAFGHAAVEGFFFWGFMGQAIRWGRGAGHEPGPLFHRVRDLIHNEWMTREMLTTDGDGCARFRGFLGDYVLRYGIRAEVHDGVRFRVGRQEAMPLTITAPLAGPSGA